MRTVVERDFWTQRILENWEHRSVLWLHGVRRVGKTTLVRSLDGVEYFDCELASVRRRFSDPETALRSLGGRRIILDEVHRLPNPSALLKVAADHFPDIKVIATGSSTLAATAKFSDSLAGRKRELWLTPMIHTDLTAFGGDIERRLIRGGLPPFFMGDSAEVDVGEWMQSYWARDVQELFRVERRWSFIRLIELLLAASGGLFEATRFAGECEITRQSVMNYLDILETTRAVSVVRPFSTRRTSEIVRAPKVYGFDTGFVRHYAGWSDPRPEDLGILWEHYVLNELQAALPYVSPRFWRTKSGREVDFVIPLSGGQIAAIECKWSAYNSNDFPGLRAFRAAYPDGPTYVVGRDVTERHPMRLGEGQVEFVPISELGAALAELAPRP